jgi:hypothetical protein
MRERLRISVNDDVNARIRTQVHSKPCERQWTQAGGSESAMASHL